MTTNVQISAIIISLFSILSSVIFHTKYNILRMLHQQFLNNT